MKNAYRQLQINLVKTGYTEIPLQEECDCSAGSIILTTDITRQRQKKIKDWIKGHNTFCIPKRIRKV